MNRCRHKLVVTILAAVFASDMSSAMADSATLYSGWKSVGEWREVAEGRSYWLGIYWGVSHNTSGEGMGHEMAWNCPTAAQIVNGELDSHGYCSMVDPVGEQDLRTICGKGGARRAFQGTPGIYWRQREV